MSTWQSLFHPLVVTWFTAKFGTPTEPQLKAWPPIAAGKNTLVAAPTGSGKTFSAFLVSLDSLLKKSLQQQLPEGIEVLYISPLKALSNDIERNLQEPLQELQALALAQGLGELGIRAAVRTGDTPARERQAMIKNPPHILVTTPESLYLLLTSEKGRERLRTVKSVIVDEIHALARDKRGSHLALSLERLDRLCDVKPVRIGLSATQKPIEEIGQFLVGSPHGQEATPCTIIDGGHARYLNLAISVPPTELAAVCSHEQWGEVYGELVEQIQAHRSTLIFVNTRRLAERISHHLTELLGEEAVASHHGSLSRQIRHNAEQRLKAGKLKAIVATASLEMGIDIGYIDLVCQIGSPRSIATFLQRVGRSGHSLGKTPKGRLYPLTRDELLECMALVQAVQQKVLDKIEIPQAPLDILAQQIVATVAAEGEIEETDLFNCMRGAHVYRNLTAEDYQAVLQLLAEGVKAGSKLGTYIHRDRVNHIIRPKKGAKLTALLNGGAIPDRGEYRVVTVEEGTFVGSVDEDFAIDSSTGDIFLLGGTSWRIRKVVAGEVQVSDAEGAPPTIPFWFGEGPGRTIELSHEVSRVRSQLAEFTREYSEEQFAASPLLAQLHEWYGVCPAGAIQALRYVAAQQAALGVVPTGEQIVFERFFDDSGGMQLVIHAPLGARINRAWGLALRKRFCRSFDFELQAAADDDGVLLSLSPQHSFPIDQLFTMLGPHNGYYLLEQAVLAAPMFQVRWRWNANRALAVLRRHGDKAVPPHLQKFRSEDLLACAFPETVGCLENHHGDVKIPDHPLVKQTMHDCLTDAMDVHNWLAMLTAVKEGRIQFIPRDTREPSPFCHELLNANPYAFLDGAPLEERRTRAVSTRRSLNPDDYRDLARLDVAAIVQVTEEAWPTAHTAEELHELLQNITVLHAYELTENWLTLYEQLQQQGRVCRVQLPDGTCFCFAAEQWPVVRAAYPQATCSRIPVLPAEIDKEWEAHAAWVELVRGRMLHSGPVTPAELAALLSLETSQVAASLEALEGQGVVLRGQFTASAWEAGAEGRNSQWCDRRLLARMHRLTLTGLRKAIAPVEPADYWYFLTKHHGLTPNTLRTGAQGVKQCVQQLEGYELAASAWESHLLTARMQEYEARWLDELFLTGELMWGRLCPPAREDAAAQAQLTRVVPIALLFREHLPWLLPQNRSENSASATSGAADVLTLLQQRGALFLPELRAKSQLLPTQLADALCELAAIGLVTSDMFSAIRQLTKHKRSSETRSPPALGRWSLFPGWNEPVERQQRLKHWCYLLLRRYGVVFRELLMRETAAPSWSELVPIFRKLELQGEVRGGRFVSQVAGEQYGMESIISQLRQAREERQQPAAAQQWCVVSAVDVLNLQGILNSEQRITANARSACALYLGQCVAWKQGGKIEFAAQLPGELQYAMRRALQIGRRDAGQELAAQEAARQGKKLHFPRKM